MLGWPETKGEALSSLGLGRRLKKSFMAGPYLESRQSTQPGFLQGKAGVESCRGEARCGCLGLWSTLMPSSRDMLFAHPGPGGEGGCHRTGFSFSPPSQRAALPFPSSSPMTKSGLGACKRWYGRALNPSCSSRRPPLDLGASPGWTETPFLSWLGKVKQKGAPVTSFPERGGEDSE